MRRFEFNTVLVSIVLAFAISAILTAWGRLIRNRERVTLPALFVLSSSWVLLAIVVHGFGLWAYEQAPFDRILETVLVLLPALVVSLVCFVWIHDIPSSGQLDLENHYFEAGRWNLPLIGLFLLLGALADVSVPLPRLSGSLPSGRRPASPCASPTVGPSTRKVFGVSWLFYIAVIGVRL